MTKVQMLLAAVAAAACTGAALAQPIVFTQWDFNALPIGSNNGPTPSKGLGAAVPVGMTNSYNQGVRPGSPSRSVPNCDVLAAQDNVNPGGTSVNQGRAWRVRGINPTVSTIPPISVQSNGWSIFSPQYGQGAEFRVNASNFTNIKFELEWFTTGAGIQYGMIQYSIDGGATWTNFLTAPLLQASPSTGNRWRSDVVADFTGVAGVDRASDLRVRYVTAYTPGYTGPNAPTFTASGGGEYNNNSGNWRFDDVRFTGTPVGPVSPGLIPSVDVTAICNNATSQLVFRTQVAPGVVPDSTGLSVSANLSALGVATPLTLLDSGTGGDDIAGDGNYAATVTIPGGAPTGVASVQLTVSDAQARSSSGSVNITVADCSVNSVSRVVISQAFTAGGNVNLTTGALAPFDSDFVELYNRSAQNVSLDGWSVQYASATGANGFNNAANKVDLSGIIKPGQYILVRMSSPVAGFSALPTPDFSVLPGLGGIDNTDGRIALVRSATLLGTDCSSALIEDFAGYGLANCFEGVGAARTTTITQGIVRKASGATDVNQNFADFELGAPNPRNRSTGGFVAGYPTLSADSICTGSVLGFVLSAGPSANAGNTTVVADVSQISGSPTTVNLTYDANQQVFTGSYSIPVGAAQGVRTVSFTTTSGSQSDVSNARVAVADCSVNSAARVVISKLFSGGGNNVNGFTNDFVEIFNRTGQSVNIDGWSLQYADATPVAGISSLQVPLSGIIPPYSYRLIVTNNTSTTGAPIPTRDFTASPFFGMDNQFGRVALVRTTTPVGLNVSGGDIEDYVGYGAITAEFEGVASVPALSNITIAIRNSEGFVDRNQNALDFTVRQTAGLPALVINNALSAPATPQPGACCLANGSCVSVLASACTGTFRGPGLACGNLSCALPNVVCCRGATCTLIAAADCTVPVSPVVGVVVSAATGCGINNNATTGCCFADFNKAGGVTIDDIFIYLNAWFAPSPFADVGGNGTGTPNIDDIFIFLNAWFSGC